MGIFSDPSIISRVAPQSSVSQVEGTSQFILSLTAEHRYAIMERARALAEAAGMTEDQWRAASRGDGRGGGEHDISVVLGLITLQPATVA